MTAKQIEKVIDLIEPSGPLTSSQPTVKWIYRSDLVANTLEVVFVNLKTFEKIRFSGIDGKENQFTAPECLPRGNYEVYLRGCEAIELLSNKRRVGIVESDEVSKKEDLYSTRVREYCKPECVGPEGSVSLSTLKFEWLCDLRRDIESFVVQLRVADSGKLIKSWGGIPNDRLSFEMTKEELQSINLGHYYWVVKAVYLEKDLISEPMYFVLIQDFSKIESEVAEDHFISGSEREPCIEFSNSVVMLEGDNPLPAQQVEKPKTIEVSDAGIKFKKVISGKQRNIGRSLTSIFKRGAKSEVFWALKGITFSVKEGEVLGVIGKNGAGKTTLLKLLTGVLIPDEGTIQIDGRISALLALGSGFMPDLSGRDNIYLSGSYMGLSKKQLTEIYGRIVEFAELGDFIDTQVRYYSSGMKARLGFSVAVHVDPEILIIDEVLGAGDKDFRKKAEKKMREFMEKAKAIVIASHSSKLITDLCTRCVWLEKGSMMAFGLSSEVVKEYLES